MAEFDEEDLRKIIIEVKDGLGAEDINWSICQTSHDGNRNIISAGFAGVDDSGDTDSFYAYINFQHSLLLLIAERETGNYVASYNLNSSREGKDKVISVVEGNTILAQEGKWELSQETKQHADGAIEVADMKFLFSPETIIVDVRLDDNSYKVTLNRQDTSFVFEEK